MDKKPSPSHQMICPKWKECGDKCDWPGRNMPHFMRDECVIQTPQDNCPPCIPYVEPSPEPSPFEAIMKEIDPNITFVDVTPKPSPSPQMKDSKPNKRSHPNALRLFNDGVQYGCSTDIGGDTSYGYGVLDEYGFWEYPLYFDVEPSPAKCPNCGHKIHGQEDNKCLEVIYEDEFGSKQYCQCEGSTKSSPEPMPHFQITPTSMKGFSLLTWDDPHKSGLPCRSIQMETYVAEFIVKTCDPAHDQQVRKAAIAEFAEKCIKTMPLQHYRCDRGKLLYSCDETRSTCFGCKSWQPLAIREEIIAHLRAMGEKR